MNENLYKFMKDSPWQIVLNEIEDWVISFSEVKEFYNLSA